jgi:phosphopantetheine--protein transferase-like protein
MAGEDALDELVAYLSRLTGETLSADQPTSIRSVHRAALTAWARKRNIPISFEKAGPDGTVRLRDLLAGGAGGPVAAAIIVPPSAAPVLPHGASPLSGIGIDIEEVGALPQADDYREHAFYRDNFTDAEVAYCIRQADAKASLCGLWAAKEAIFKAGLADAPSGHFKTIEIARDKLGRPSFPGGQLSISHTPTTAVAVCVAFGVAQPAPKLAPPPAPPAPAPIAPPVSPAPVRAEAPPPARRFGRLALGIGLAAGVVLVAAGSAASLVFHLWQ